MGLLYLLGNHYYKDLTPNGALRKTGILNDFSASQP
jgi:hypothetical protein